MCLLHFLLCPPNEVSGDILCLLCFLFWPKKSWANGRHFQIGRRQNRQNFNVLWFQWKLISIFCFKRGPNRGEVYKRNMYINYFLISAHLSNSITSDNRGPNNALNSDMRVVLGTSVFASKPRSYWNWRIPCFLGNKRR